MHYRIHFFHDAGVSSAVAERVGRIFLQNPGPLSVVVEKRSVTLPKNSEEVIPWDQAFATLSQLRKDALLPTEDLLAVLTGTPNENHWFAVQDPQNPGQGFIHVDDYRWVTSAPQEAIIAHLALHGFLNFLLHLAGIDWEDNAHKVARGCFNDFCGEKKDLDLGLRTADICGDCLQLLTNASVPDELIRQVLEILETIRGTALGAKQYLRLAPAFDDWPFPVSITKHNATQSTHSVLRLLFLLDHFDSLVRYSFIASELSSGRSPMVVERPSLGWWVDQLAASRSGVPELKKVVRIASEERIVSLRNEHRGHGWLSSEDDGYREECLTLENALSRIEDALLPLLHGYLLVRLCLFTMDEGLFVLTGERLSGSHILHPPFTLRTKTDPRSLGIQGTNKIYLMANSGEQWWDCSPHIIRAVCPKCRHERVLVTDGPGIYIDTQIGHRVEIPCC